MEVINTLERSKKINYIDVRLQQRTAHQRKIHSKDVRIHHRICDDLKHLLQGKSNFIEKPETND